jgi:hypothetical protein
MVDQSNSILIGDDEELNSESLGRCPRRHGYAGTVVKSGREAGGLLGRRPF